MSEWYLNLGICWHSLVQGIKMSLEGVKLPCNSSLKSIQLCLDNCENIDSLLFHVIDERMMLVIN